MPTNVGVVAVDELPLAGAVIATVGAVVSMRNVTAALVPVLPARSPCVACTVYVPSARAAGVAANAPAASTPPKVWIGDPVAVPPA